jgi:hypothetical protein
VDRKPRFRRVPPRVNAQFSRDEKLGLYLQIYNLTPGESGRKPRGNIRYEIARTGSNEAVIEQREELAGIPDASVDQVTIGKLIPLNSVGPGADGDHILQRQARFSVR